MYAHTKKYSYRRLLACTDGTTGDHSVYAAYKGCEIMYHVSTLLPFYPDDVQQVERKRHLGNDVCLIVFRDKGCAPFDPLVIKSQFNRSYQLASTNDVSVFF